MIKKINKKMLLGGGILGAGLYFLAKTSEAEAKSSGGMLGGKDIEDDLGIETGETATSVPYTTETTNDPYLGMETLDTTNTEPTYSTTDTRAKTTTSISSVLGGASALEPYLSEGARTKIEKTADSYKYFNIPQKTSQTFNSKSLLQPQGFTPLTISDTKTPLYATGNGFSSTPRSSSGRSVSYSTKAPSAPTNLLRKSTTQTFSRVSAPKKSYTLTPYKPRTTSPAPKPVSRKPVSKKPVSRKPVSSYFRKTKPTSKYFRRI